MTRPGIEPTTSRSRGGRLNHKATVAVGHDPVAWAKEKPKEGLHSSQDGVIILNKNNIRLRIVFMIKMWFGLSSFTTTGVAAVFTSLRRGGSWLLT